VTESFTGKASAVEDGFAPAKAPPADTQRSRLHAIDFLRGVAILAVIWHHASSLVVYPPSMVPEIFRWVPWLRGGWFGVNLFFILSGFVLYLPYAQSRRHMEGWPDASGFARHRASRLLPLYYSSTALLLVFNFWPSSASEATTQVLSLATLTFGFSTATFFPKPNWVLWSLAVEVWFTVFFVLLAVAMRRYPRVPLAVAVLSMSLFVRWVGTVWAAADIPGHQLNPVRDSVLGRLDDFFVGMLLAAWYARRATYALPGAGRRLALIAGGIALATLAPLSWELNAVGIVTAKWPVIFANNAIQAGTAMVLVALLGKPATGPRHYAVLGVELLGMMCYSLYVWHGVVMARVMPSLSASGVLLYAVALLTVSALSYRYIEFGRVRNWRQLVPTRALMPKES
jgi:peptidoglycan/LPS O-acetylase OafA/YrhL